ncbi:MAG: hypothetical protein J5921_01595 [Clostridia bacterium]|nr:hypothetical protein [Clostridia bacterium]
MAFGKKNNENAPDIEPKEDEQFVDLVFDLESGELSIQENEDAASEAIADADDADDAYTDAPEGTFVPVKGFGGETAAETETLPETGEAGEADEEVAESEKETYAAEAPAEAVEEPAAETEENTEAEEPYEARYGTEETYEPETAYEVEDAGETEYAETAPASERHASLYDEGDGSVSEDDLPTEWVGAEKRAEEARESEPEGENEEENDDGHSSVVETRVDKVKAEKLEDLIRKKTAGNSDYAKGKLSGFIGVYKNGEGANAIGGLSFKTWSFITLAVFVIDTVLLNFLAYKIVYPIVEIVMKNAGIQALGESLSKEPLYTAISYAISFIFCGLIVLILCKLTEAIIGMLGSTKISSIITKTLLCLMAVFTVIGLIVMIVSKKGLLTLTAYRWFSPALSYAGGLVFFLVAGLGKKNKK